MYNKEKHYKEMKKYPNIEPCIDCYYWRYIFGGCTPICNYILDNEQPRGCPIGEGCDKFLPKRPKEEKQ